MGLLAVVVRRRVVPIELLRRLRVLLPDDTPQPLKISAQLSIQVSGYELVVDQSFDGHLLAVNHIGEATKAQGLLKQERHCNYDYLRHISV